MDLQTLKTIIRDAGHKPRRYSGRNMYGKQCVGVSFDQPVTEMFADLADAVDDPSHIGWLLRHVSQDQMGRGTILYWPDVEWEDEEPEEE